MRLVSIGGPLIDAHAIRQCYTAEASRSMLRESGFPMTLKVNWRGDRDVRLALELPVYNYLTIAAYHVLGDLDVSGKVVSIGFWALSFLVLQQIWKRCLNEAETFWAPK